MKSFTDNQGRAWTLALSVTSVKRVRDLVKIDLLSAVESGATLIGRLMDDPILLADVVWCLVADQANAAGIDDARFGEALAGDAIDGATNALLEELADFFRLPAQRAAMRKVIAKSRALSETVLGQAMQRIDTMDLEAEASKLLRRGDSSTSSPESAASTPAP